MPTIYRPPRAKRPYQTPQTRNYEFYNSQAWRKWSKAYRLRHPWCERCLNNDRYVPAVMTDHIHPINQGGELFPNYEGLQSLCKSCEGKKNRSDRGGFDPDDDMP